MATNRLNSFRITVILVVFIILCYVDWSPNAKQRSRRSTLTTSSTTVYDSCKTNGDIGVTFDEGPTTSTRKILDILKEKNITATFHLVPSNIKDNLENAKAIVDEGHLVGLRLNTNLKDDQLKSLTVDKIKEELEKEATIISEALGVNPKFLRLPFDLDKNDKYLKAVDELGFVLTNSIVDLSGTDKADQFVKTYEKTLKEQYNKESKNYPKFIDYNQDGLETIPEAWKKIVKLLENYEANPVTLDICTGIKEKYRTASNDMNGQSKSAATPKTISSLMTTFTFALVIIFFLL